MHAKLVIQCVKHIPVYVVIGLQRFLEVVKYFCHVCGASVFFPGITADSTLFLELDSIRYAAFHTYRLDANFHFRFQIFLLLLLQYNVCFSELKLHGFIVTDKLPSATSTHWSVLMFISRFGQPFIHFVQIQRVSGVSELHVSAVIMSLKWSTLIHCP